MRGERWDAMKAGYRKCLSELKKMKNIIVTVFTYDDNVNPHASQETPIECIKKFEKLPFTQGETNYTKALEAMTNVMENVKEEYKEYCSFLIFLSDGEAEFPKEACAKIVQMKKSGKKIIFYTVACVTTDDKSMTTMTREIGGEHFRISNPEGGKIIFTQILGA